jgi:hypothetical protein
MVFRLRQQGILRFIVADFRPARENRQQKDSGYRMVNSGSRSSASVATV